MSTPSLESAMVAALRSLPLGLWRASGIETSWEPLTDRIRWDEADSRWTATRGYIVLHDISDESLESSDGPSGLCFANVQLNCVADSTHAAIALREAVKRWFGNYSGTHGGVRLVVIERLNQFTVPQSVVGGKEETTKVKALEYKVSYTEEVPVSYRV